MDYKCKDCNYVGIKENFGKPCPKCNNSIIAHFNKKETKIAKIFIDLEKKINNEV